MTPRICVVCGGPIAATVHPKATCCSAQCRVLRTRQQIKASYRRHRARLGFSVKER